MLGALRGILPTASAMISMWLAAQASDLAPWPARTGVVSWAFGALLLATIPSLVAVGTSEKARAAEPADTAQADVQWPPDAFSGAA